MSKEQIYLGQGVSKFDGDSVEFTLNLTKLGADASEFFFEYNGNKYIKLKVNKLRKPNDYGKTHTVLVNTFKPDEVKETASAKKQEQDDDLPF